MVFTEIATFDGKGLTGRGCGNRAIVYGKSAGYAGRSQQFDVSRCGLG